MKKYKLNINVLKYIPIFLTICMLNSCFYINDEKSATDINTPIPTTSTTAPLPSEVAKNIAEKNTSPNLDPKYTSPELIDLVKDYISHKKEDELFKLATGKELDKNSLVDLKINDEGRDYLNNVLDGNGCITLVDIDNDKTDDIITYEYSGGSDGFVNFAILKKNESDIYEFSEYPSFLNIESKYGYIRYKDKNYYIDESWDYYKNIFDGINIYSYDKGKLVEHVFVAKYSDSIQLSTEYISGNTYNDLLNKISEEAKSVFTMLNKSKIYNGKIEKKLSNNKTVKDVNIFWDIDDWQEVDIDNDNSTELVGKYFGFPNKTRYFGYVIKKEEKNKLSTIDLQKTYNIELDNDNYYIQQLWFEKYNNNVYLVALTQDKEKNVYHIKVFLLSASSAKRIIDIKAVYIKQACAEVWTDGINIEFKHATKYEPPRG